MSGQPARLRVIPTKKVDERTPQDKGRDFETEVARRRAMHLHPASGAFVGRQADMSGPTTVVELKHVTTDRHTIRLGQLMDLLRQAELTRKDGRYVVYFEAEDITLEGEIYRGRPS